MSYKDHKYIINTLPKPEPYEYNRVWDNTCDGDSVFRILDNSDKVFVGIVTAQISEEIYKKVDKFGKDRYDNEEARIIANEMLFEYLESGKWLFDIVQTSES